MSGVKACQELYMIMTRESKSSPHTIYSVLSDNWSVALDKRDLTSFGKTAEKWTTKSPPNPSHMSSSGERTYESRHETRHCYLTPGLMCPHNGS